jgi:hypothetical protein
MMKGMAGMGMRERIGLASQIGRAGMLGGKLPQIKARTPIELRRRREKRRKERKKHRR